jgi:hypothetical protein
MPELKLKQLQYETETWRRLLGFMTDENIRLKNRLSEILRNEFDKDLLEEVEIFQSNFIKQDERISLLRNEVAGMDKLLTREIFEDGIIIKKIDKKIKHIRHIIRIAEEQFAKLKSGFNNYLSKNILAGEKK